MHKKSHLALLLAALACTAAPSRAADAPAAPVPGAATVAPVPAPAPAARRCTSVVSDEQPTYVMLGKSAVIPLKSRVTRILVGGHSGGGSRAPAAAPMPAPGGAIPAGAPASQGNASDGVGDLEVTLLSPTDLFFKAGPPVP